MVQLKEKKTKKAETNEFVDVLKKIVNSRHLIVIGLLILVITLVWFSNYLMRSNHTYTFSGRGEYISILNGAI